MNRNYEYVLTDYYGDVGWLAELLLALAARLMKMRVIIIEVSGLVFSRVTDESFCVEDWGRFVSDLASFS